MCILQVTENNYVVLEGWHNKYRMVENPEKSQNETDNIYMKQIIYTFTCIYLERERELAYSQ